MERCFDDDVYAIEGTGAASTARRAAPRTSSPCSLPWKRFDGMRIPHLSDTTDAAERRSSS